MILTKYILRKYLHYSIYQGKLSEKVFPKINKLFCKDDNCLIHGDLCFSNILYDVPNNQYRIIDPRGKWGDSVFGDIKYDLAKLRHSIVGGYDSINNGLFSINQKDNSLKMNILNAFILIQLILKHILWFLV